MKNYLLILLSIVFFSYPDIVFSKDCTGDSLTPLDLIECKKEGRLHVPKSEKKKFAPIVSFIQPSEIHSEVGCDSRYSEEKRMDIFNTKYRFKFYRWELRVYKSERGAAHFKLGGLDSLKVSFGDGKTGYDLLKGEVITVVFRLDDLDCSIGIADYIGTHAFIE